MLPASVFVSFCIKRPDPQTVGPGLEKYIVLKVLQTVHHCIREHPFTFLRLGLSVKVLQRGRITSCLPNLIFER